MRFSVGFGATGTISMHMENLFLQAELSLDLHRAEGEIQESKGLERVAGPLWGILKGALRRMAVVGVMTLSSVGPSFLLKSPCTSQRG